MNFIEEFNKLTIGYSDYTIAWLLHVSLPTVRAYRAGMCAPLPLTAESLLDILRRDRSARSETPTTST